MLFCLGSHAGLCVCEDKGVVAVDNQPISQLWRYSIELVVPVFSHKIMCKCKSWTRAAC